VLVKRDDLTGLAFGGNKTRKLEYLVARARESGAQTLITTGAVQSNHCRQTAAAAARSGFQCILVLSGTFPGDKSGNLLLDHLLGAEIVWTNQRDRDSALREVFEEAQAAGKNPFLIPYGGSSPAGAIAYAYALQELLNQDIQPDWILFASSSGGTQAGLLVGARLFGYTGRILGISVDQPASILTGRVKELAQQTAAYLGEKMTFSEEEIMVNDQFLGGGYGVMGDIELEAIQLFARLEGLLLDPVYTGRAAGGLISLVRSGFFKPGQKILFWHTGGTPALFADPYRGKLAGD
jgi:D-cysteine desulfhydrase family pyridoxal phosphate-dependent enzyme